MYVRYALRRFKAWFVPLCGTLRMSNIAISQCCSYAACLSANCACSNLQLLCARHLNATHTEAGTGTPSQQIWWNFYGTINVRLCVYVCASTESLYYALALGILALALTNGDLQLRVQHLSSDAKRATPPPPHTHTHKHTHSGNLWALSGRAS